MKIDVDSYLYIIITIVILIVTALSRKKKKPVQVPGQAAGHQVTSKSEQEEYDPNEGATTEQVLSDPFERLEKLFAPPETTFVVEEDEPPPTKPIMDVNSEARRIKELEEERKLRHREAQQEEMVKAFRLHSDSESTMVTGDEGEFTLSAMFDDPEDITKAIIYSEIFNKREF